MTAGDTHQITSFTLEQLYLEHVRCQVDELQTIRIATLLFPDQLEALHRLMDYPLVTVGGLGHA